MSTISFLGGILLLSLGQSAPGPIYQAVVILPEADVRARPGTGPQIYATNRLHQNDPVQVVHELSDGWLEILPPPGSFSWINKRDISNEGFPNHPNNWVVKSTGRDQIPVFIGSNITPGTRGTVVGVKLKTGYQMPNAFGRHEVNDPEGTWLPIEAPIGETRYIRAETVRKIGPLVASGAPYPATNPYASANTYTAGVSPVGLPPLAGSPPRQGGGFSPGAYNPGSPESLWQRAQRAEQMGNVNETIQLYSQLASQSSGVSHQTAMLALNRAYLLKDSQRNSPMPVVPVVQPVTQVSVPAIQVAPTGGTQPAPSSFTAYTTQYPGTQLGRATTPNTAPWQAVTPEGYPSSGPGRLRRAGRMLDGRKSYVLISNQNYPLLYCTPHTGIDLESFLDQNVESIGPAIYRGELRANYMTVVRVQPLP